MFGSPSLFWQDESVQAASQKGQALLYTLCLRPSGVPRGELAELLWGVGRVQNVRQELTSLRTLPGAASWLHTGERVSATVESDVRAFEAALSEKRYADAIRLYPAPLLKSVTIARAPAFTDWLEVERQRLEDLLRRALRQQADLHRAAADYRAALQLLDRLIELDPLDEMSYRTAMHVNFQSGDLAAALEYFAACRQVLLTEFGAEPLPETVELYEQVSARYRVARPALNVRSRGIAALPDRALQLAQVLVLTHTLPVDQLALILETTAEEVNQSFNQLAKHQLLSGQRLSAEAVHAVREATPESVSLYLHARAAQVQAEAGGPPERIAAHLLAAKQPGEAAAWWLEAARNADRQLDTTQAVSFVFRALWAAAAGRQRIELLLQLERLATQLGDAPLREEALRTVEHEGFLLQDDLLLIEINLRRVMQLVQLGQAGTALQLARDTARSAERIGRRDLLTRTNHLVGAAALHASDFDEAHAAFTDVVANGAPAEQLPALNNLGVLAGIRGDVDAALAYHEQALTLARELGDRGLIAGVLNNLGATGERAAQYDKAARSFEEAARLYAVLNDPRGGMTAWSNAAEVRLKQGRNASCAAALASATALTAGLDAPALRARLQLLEGLLLRQQADFPAALDHLRSALETATGTENERLLATIRFNLEITKMRLDPERPREAAQAEAQRLENMNLNDVLPWVYADLGQLSSSAAEARNWADRLTQFDDNPHVRLLLLLLEQHANLLDGDKTVVPGLAALAEQLEVAELPLAEELLAAAAG